ncbi:hypothetical protein [Thiolapillus sp.]
MTHGKIQGKCLLAASMALLTSAILLMGGFILWQPATSADTSLPPAITLEQKDFLPDPREGETTAGGVRLKTPGPRQQVIVPLSRTGFEADRYPMFRYRVEGWTPGLKLALYWRSTASPDTTRFIDLPWTPLAKTTLSLEHNPWWKGRITHIGFYLRGGIPDRNLIIHKAGFFQATPVRRISAILSDWCAIHEWNMSSINSVANAAPHTQVFPVPVSAAWAGLALLIYAGWLQLFHGKHHRCTAAGLLLLVLLPWLMLHGRWQMNLWVQLQDTRQLYAGKTQHEKHLLAEDADLYHYARHLKNDVLPGSPARIIILHRDFRSYPRLKLQYYLLPHNSYNYDSFPQAAYLHGGDYILAMGTIPGLRFIPEQGRLQWTGGRSIRVTRLDESGPGTLYRVEEDSQ